MRALQNFKDVYGVDRRVGDEWLVTRDDAAAHTVGVHEQRVATVSLIVLTAQQYCVIDAPWDDNGEPQRGRKEVRRGPAQFFVRPGETLDGSVKPVELVSKRVFVAV